MLTVITCFQCKLKISKDYHSSPMMGLSSALVRARYPSPWQLLLSFNYFIIQVRKNSKYEFKNDLNLYPKSNLIKML